MFINQPDDFTILFNCGDRKMPRVLSPLGKILRFRTFLLLFYGFQRDKFGERSRVSPCFGMPVPPAVSCFLSCPFHSLSTSPFNGSGACRTSACKVHRIGGACISADCLCEREVANEGGERVEPRLAWRTIRESDL